MQSKRFSLAIATLTSLTLIAAACGGSSDSSTRTKNAALSPTSTVSATAASTSLPAVSSAPTSAVSSATTAPTTIASSTTSPTATSLPAQISTASTPTTIAPLNPLDCPITAVVVGGSAATNDVRVKVSACRPMEHVQISYYKSRNKITWSILANVPNSASIEIAELASIQRLGPGIPDAISIEPFLTSGDRLPTVILPLSATVQTAIVKLPPPTTTLPPTTTAPPTTTTTIPLPPCSITWDGKQLVACKAFRSSKFQFFGANGPVSGSMGGTTVIPTSSTNLFAADYPGTKFARISIDFVDGSSIINVDIAIGSTVGAPFSSGPTVTTTPTPGCDLRVAYGAISSPNCGAIFSYSYQWHNGITTISGKQTATTPSGVATVYLGSRMPPKEATGALVTLTFLSGKVTRNVLVPLTEPTKTIRAPF